MSNTSTNTQPAGMGPQSPESGTLMSSIISHENSKQATQSQPPTPCHTPPPPSSQPSQTSLPLHNIHTTAPAEEHPQYASPAKADSTTLPTSARVSKLHILICSTGGKDTSQAEALAVRLSKNSIIECRAVVDSPSVRIKQYIPVIANRRGYYADVPDLDGNEGQEKGNKQDTQAERYGGLADDDGEGEDVAIAHQLASWADILILAPIDADTLGRMVHGLTGSPIASILRGWDVGKKIIMIPGMSRAMWEHPMTRKQIVKIRRKWSWVRVLEPILWAYEDGDGGAGRRKVFLGWNGLHDVVELVQNMVAVRGIGEGEESSAHQAQLPLQDGNLGEERKRRFNKRLPPEIWSLIFTHMGDWETAQNLGIYTALPPPKDWERCLEMVAKDFPPPPATMPPESKTQWNIHMESLRLQYAILTQPLPAIIALLSAPTSAPLTPLSVKLVVKFNYLPLLQHIASTLGLALHYDAFTDPIIPHKASYNYNRPQILEWWKQHLRLPGHPEPHRHYGPEAIDGASKQGFIEVLEWWRRSGLPLKYTEAALEQASARGLVHVLEWWKAASLTSGHGHAIDEGLRGIRRSNTGTTSPAPSDGSLTPSAALRLKVGKSILTAAQHGHADVVRWWVESGIPFSHEEGVAKIASAYGHVGVLETWKELKGEKFSMCYDSQVLVGATKNGFVRVLEWWRGQTLGGVGGGEGGEGNDAVGGGKRLKVEYKTCDIEEALEDSVEMEGGEGEGEVRRWWERNGLNLGVATGEWMELKSL